MSCDVFFFFFSSRRRHTRYIGDWSSDVCSSDLGPASGSCTVSVNVTATTAGPHGNVSGTLSTSESGTTRSEERRVGKEGRTRWWADQSKKKRERTETGYM